MNDTIPATGHLLGAADIRRIAADAGIRAAAELEPNDISLYVGIPFCPTRCAYCSFVAQSVEKSFSLVDPYLEALFDEITAAGQLVHELGLNVKSFYMGGGTPTTLTADQMDRLLSKLEQNFDFNGLAELTIEAGRPDTIDEEKLRVLRAHNTTRHQHLARISNFVSDGIQIIVHFVIREVFLTFVFLAWLSVGIVWNPALIQSVLLVIMHIFHLLTMP